MTDAIYVICYPGEKRPIGNDWINRRLTWSEVQQRLKNNPALNVGIVLGPISGIIDVECDTPEAAQAFAELFPGIRTLCWKSARGWHYLFYYDARLAHLPGVVHLDGVEFRLGNGGAIQSICPPSTVDGVTRTWIVKPGECDIAECDIAKLPEHIIAQLAKLPPCKKQTRTVRASGVSSGDTAAQKLTVKRILPFCRKAGITVVSVRPDNYDAVYIDVVCPEKHPDNAHDGNPAFIVNEDGTYGYHCFHTGCLVHGKLIIHEKFGPLLPTIHVGPDLAKSVQETLAAMSGDTGLYQRGGALVVPMTDAPAPKQCLHSNGSPSTRVLTTPSLAPILSEFIDFQKYDEKQKKFRSCLASPAVVNGVLNSPCKGNIPVITGMLECPNIRLDGSVITAPGYDTLTGRWLDTSGNYPPLMERSKAVSMLLDLLSDFPFADDAHRSVWIAALVTLVSRPAFAGPSPLFLFDGNVSRVGKGLLTDLLTGIIEGRTASRYSFPKDQAELRKVITTVAIAGNSYMLFDNIKDRFGGAVLEAAITSGRHFDRILCENIQVDIALSNCWLATSNNATVTKDMVGRVCYSRLETSNEDPGTRSGFRYPDLFNHVKDHRNELAMAALSLPAAYIAAGRPDLQLSSWGGFEGWSNLVRNSLVYAGLPDCDTRKQLADSADDETEKLAELLDAWAEVGCSTVKDAVAKAGFVDGSPLLAAFLHGLDGNRADRLGKLLRGFKGRILGGRKIDKINCTPTKWTVVKC